MIFHLFLNSLFVFLILTCFVEFFLFMFKVDHARLRYVYRLFPLLKLPFDLLVLGIYGENLFINFNPFSCEMYMHEFITYLLPHQMQTDLSPGEHFVIPTYLAAQIPAASLQFFIWGVIIISLLAIGRKIFLFIKSKNDLEKILSRSTSCSRKIFNSHLLNCLNQLKVRLLVSDQIHIPFAANLHYIVMPSHLIAKLSQEEFEAVIVHELEHLRWKDPVLKLLSGLICSLFWWIPSSWWLKRLEGEQEQACDAQVYHYGINTHALATAMIKVVKRARYLQCQFSAICPFDSPKNSHIKRLEKILQPNHPRKKGALATDLAGLLLLFSFYMFLAVLILIIKKI